VVNDAKELAIKQNDCPLLKIMIVGFLRCILANHFICQLCIGTNRGDQPPYWTAVVHATYAQEKALGGFVPEPMLCPNFQWLQHSFYYEQLAENCSKRKPALSFQ